MKKYLLLLLFLFPFILIAGTSTIRVDTEGWGTITNPQGDVLSLKGSMFWNGSKWVSNETSAHMYFTYIETGKRLNPPINIDISARTSNSFSFDTLGYHFVRKNYTYTDFAKQGGSYRYEAIQYQIEPSAGRKVVLQSRGTGNGKEKGYFNIYIEDTVNYITALRNDPQWFTYKGMSMDSALKQNSATQYLTGSLSSANGYYFMDVNGGADMAGLSYIFHTDSLTASPKTDVLGSSFPIDFGLRILDTVGRNVVEFRFLPKLVSETYIAPATLAVNTTSLDVNYGANSMVKLDITSNLDWTVISDKAWLTVSSGAGTGNGTVTLTAEANPSAIPRTATVTVSAAGVTPQTVTVTQAAAPAVLTVNTSSLTIGYAAGSTASFSVTSNADWTIDSGQSWLMANPATGTGNKTITLTAQANTLPDYRLATVTISATGAATQSIQVTQSINTALEAAHAEQFLVYPNPFTEGIYVRGIKNRAVLRLAELTGRVLLIKEMEDDGFFGTASLPAGIYLLRMVNSKGTIEQKLIKR